VPAVWLATCLALATATPAAADTSTATARAAQVSAAGLGVVDSGLARADNDGSGGPVVDGGSAPLGTLGPQAIVSSGVLAQVARADADGTSAACAGLVGAGGTVSVGADGSCTTTGGADHGVVLTLAPAVVVGGITVTPAVTLRADAVLGQCTASSSGAVTSTVSLVDAGVYSGSALILPLTPSPPAGSGVTVPGVATLGLHTTWVPGGAGSIGASAMEVTLLSSGASAVIGTVTCGPNALTVPVPVVAPGTWPVLAVASAAVVLALPGTREPLARAVRRRWVRHA
jgi:hypothetical protein